MSARAQTANVVAAILIVGTVLRGVRAGIAAYQFVPKGIGAVSTGGVLGAIELAALAVATQVLLRRTVRRGVFGAAITRWHLVVAAALVAAVLGTEWWIWQSLSNATDFWTAIRIQSIVGTGAVTIQLVTLWCAAWGVVRPAGLAK